MIDGASIIERERKYRLTEDRAAALEAKLKQGGELIRHELQDSMMFGGSEGRVRKGTVVRLRSVDGQRTLTFKGRKRQDGFDKTRSELTVEIGNGPILEVLAAIGLVPTVRYVKHSTLYRFGGAIVSVDRLDGLGIFCEIECFDMVTDLEAIAKTLELDPTWFEPHGYPSLAAAAG